MRALNKKLIEAVATLLFFIFPLVSHAENLKISTIDWCPQLCPGQKAPGYVMDTVIQVFEDSPYQLITEDFPWTRAIRMVESGESIALLSPAKSEAPNLIYPKHAVGLQRMCFFTTSDSPWHYHGIESLANMKIGIANDTSIEELNAYVEQNKKQFRFLPYNDKYIWRSLKMLDSARIDAFIFTYNTTVYEINKMGWNNRYKSAGCISLAKIYMAFTPAPSKSVQVQKMVNYFDHKMAALKKSGEIKK